MSNIFKMLILLITRRTKVEDTVKIFWDTEFETVPSINKKVTQVWNVNNFDKYGKKCKYFSLFPKNLINYHFAFYEVWQKN